MPRRALRGHAPQVADTLAVLAQVSVPRRALRGHAPSARRYGRWAQGCFSAPKGVERACPEPIYPHSSQTHYVSVPRRALRGHAPVWKGGLRFEYNGFSAPKGVERACPAPLWPPTPASPTSFSAPKGVERACPEVVHGHRAGRGPVSVPRRALRGHAPLARGASWSGQSVVSVPRRALRGHAPQYLRLKESKMTQSFQCPEGR